MIKRQKNKNSSVIWNKKIYMDRKSAQRADKVQTTDRKRKTYT